ncbi:MAG: glycosyltransferase family 4 protein [Candidatus Sumerlaeota bacterium]
MNDPEGQHVVRAFGKEARIRGFGGSRKNFIKACFKHAKDTRIAFINHAFLAPIGIGMRLRNRALKYVAAVYGIEVWTRLSLIRRTGLRHASTVLTIAEFNRQHLRTTQGMIDGPSLEIIPPPYESTLSSQAVDEVEWTNLAIQRPFILCVCRVNKADERKRVETLIRAFGKISAEFPQWACCHVGSGDDRPRLEAIAGQVAPTFRFLGAVSDGALNRLYKECEFFVMPSEKEGFGIVFLEAMAHGKPVIGGNAGGTPDIIIDDEIGYLVDPYDDGNLALKMHKLMMDSSLRKAMGEKGRSRLDAVYTPENFLARMKEMLSAL